MKTHVFRSLVLSFAAILLPGAVAAQQLSVTPSSVSVQATVGTNALSQTVEVKKKGKPKAQSAWTVTENASWLSVSPTSGVDDGTLTLTFATSGLSAGQYQTVVSVVQSSGSNDSINVQVNMISAPSPLVANCPANITASSPNGNPVAVPYTIPAPSGGTAPYTTSGSPTSGSNFPLGTTTVQVTAQDSSQPTQTANCSFTVTVTFSPSPLIANCPANITASSPNGNPVAVLYTIPAPSGGTAPYTTSGSPTSGSNFPLGTTTVQVTAQDSSQPTQTANCSFTVTVTFSPSPLTANCPANTTVSSPNGNPVAVSYTIPAPSGGTAPYTTSGSPTSGSNFAVGTTTVQVTAQDSSQPMQTANCSFTVTVTYSPPPPPPPSGARGPQPGGCPGGAVDFFPTYSVAQMQSLIDANPGTTTFCFRAGLYSITAAITPKTGNTFVGEFVGGLQAILDGSNWTTWDDSQGAFRVYDDPNDPNDPTGDVDNVTIRNLVIRNMPHYGIHASYRRNPDHWLIEYNEIASNRFGVMFSRDFIVRNNYIHDNVDDPTSPNPGDRGGGYVGQYADNSIVDNNEIARNGPEQKVGLSVNVTFSNNFVHHNLGDGIWYDLNNNPVTAPLAAIIEGNLVEDNRNGIVFEISIGAIIRNNTFRRNREDAVLITVSQNAEIYNNVLEANFGGIEYFLNCGSFSEGFDLRNNAAYNNTVTITPEVSQNFGYANGFSHLAQCTSLQLAPYLNGEKNLSFTGNMYFVPSLSYTRYFLWSGWKVWTDWQALGSTMVPTQALQDDGGTISVAP